MAVLSTPLKLVPATTTDGSDTVAVLRPTFDGGAFSWKTGRDEANRTYSTTSYEAWLGTFRQASHADTLQRAGIAAVAVGGAAIVSGVIRYVWPKSRHVDAMVSPTSISGGVSLAF